MRFYSAVPRPLRAWLLSFLCWGLVAFAFGAQLAKVTSLSTETIVRIASRDWLPWAFVTPLLFNLVAWFPMERERWKLSLPIHIAAGILTIAFCRYAGELILPIPQRSPGSPRQEARSEPQSDGETPSATPRPRGGRGRGSRFFGPFGPGTLHISVYFALISVAHAIHFYRRSKERERRSLELAASLAEARVEALKMQLQPHFLFNALNAIAALVHQDPEKADEMLSALSDLLRLTLETSGEPELSLRRELQLVNRYLAIEQVRFGERLRVSTDIDANAMDALVPTFLLQPLVENAVRHGLEPKLGAGALQIRGWREKDSLCLCVEDDGAGLPANAPQRVGIGLANTRARLRELYGDAARLDLQNGDGVKVTITLPYRSAS